MCLRRFTIFLYLMHMVLGGEIDFNGTDIVKTVGSELCPYTNYCHTSSIPDIQNETHIPCCLPCSCEDDCWKLDNCCPDKDSVEPDGPPLNCKLTINKETHVYKLGGFIGLGTIRRYRVVDYCPETVHNTEIARKCRRENASELDDYRWVSEIKVSEMEVGETSVTEMQSGDIFQNRFCAECHGVQEYMDWAITAIGCNNIFESLSLLHENIMAEECSIVNSVPDEISDSMERFRCYQPHYQSCNQTGLWTQYDDQINTACNMYSASFFSIQIEEVNVYKNEFCYACNTADSGHADKVCSLNELHKGKRTTYLSFSVLLDGGVLQQLREPDKRVHQCAIDEVHDTFMVGMAPRKRN